MEIHYFLLSKNLIRQIFKIRRKQIALWSFFILGKNHNLNFSCQNLSIEDNFFKLDGKVTKIRHLHLHRIWKKFIFYSHFVSCRKIKFCFVKLHLDSWKMCSIFGIYYFESKVHFYQSKNKYRCFSRMSMVAFVFQKYYVYILLRIQWDNGYFCN